MSLKYADRLFKQKERLKKQTERIRAQTRCRSGVGVGQRRRIEEKRAKIQNKRILEQREKALKRVEGARKRGETVTGVDALERKKIGRELRWRGKWDRRKAKFDAWARRYK